MADVVLTFGGWAYDRLRPILDGEVKVEGCEIVPVRLRGEQLFPRSLQRQEFDITELSASSYLMQTARGDSAFIAVPAFVSRAFRHRSIYIRNDRGIESPKDLEGKSVGVPEYQTTIALWTRGILQDEHGVDFKAIRYVTGGVNRAGRKERLPLDLPTHMDVTPAPEGKTLSELLQAGDLDAVIAPQPPMCFGEGNGDIVRLFKDYASHEKDYFQHTGFFPIMHLIAIRKVVVERHPWLPANLFRALVEAKRIAFSRLRDMAASPAHPIVLPWLADEIERTEQLMGKDFWPYGVPANRAEIETMCRYSHEQYLAPRRLAVDELFAPETIDLSDVPAAP